MAKREVTQTSLFEEKIEGSAPPTNLLINRAKIDAIVKQKELKNEPLYTSNGYSLRCHICNTSTDYPIYVEKKYCINCDILFTIPYADNYK